MFCSSPTKSADAFPEHLLWGAATAAYQIEGALTGEGLCDRAQTWTVSAFLTLPATL
jgi:beta-glucosidase/6-phospho-beta-glucosidase/beta-galactosidase